MKLQTYIRSSLLIPYILWVMSAIGTLITSSSTNTSESSGSVINVIAFAATIYAFGIILWGIPYTLLAISLWVWSLRKQTKNIIKTFVWAPALLTIPMMIQTLITNYFSFSSYNEIAQNWQSFWSGFAYSFAAIAGFSLAYGYLSIGLVYLLYKIFWKLKIIRDEQENVAAITN